MKKATKQKWKQRLLRLLLTVMLILLAAILAELGRIGYHAWMRQPKAATLYVNNTDVGQAGSIRKEFVPIPRTDKYRLGSDYAVVPTQDILEYLGFRTEWISETQLRITNGPLFVTYDNEHNFLILVNGQEMPLYMPGDHTSYHGLRVGRLETNVAALRWIFQELSPTQVLNSRIDRWDRTISIFITNK